MTSKSFIVIAEYAVYGVSCRGVTLFEFHKDFFSRLLGKTRMIGLPYGEESNDDEFSRFEYSIGT